MFHLGQKVVCIKRGRWDYQERLREWPVSGGIYTIRGFDPCYPDGGSIFLEEIRNPNEMWLEGYGEPSFDTSKFRPIVERKTDISIFKKMLVPKRQRELAE